MYKLTLAAYMGFWVGEGVQAVGTMSEASKYTWSLPFALLLGFGIPAALGYLAGREDKP